MKGARASQRATVPGLIAGAAQRFGARPAVIDGGDGLSYAELVELSRRFGSALVSSGIASGDRVAVWAFNSTEWIVAALGIFQAGAVLVPVNTRFKGAEAADILLRSRARVLVTVTDFLGTDYVAMLARVRYRPPGSGHDRDRQRCRDGRNRVLGGLHGPRRFGRRFGRRPPVGGRRRRRPLRHPLHLGNDRCTQGGGPEPRTHRPGGHRLGGDDRPDRGGPLPHGQSVLPHVRTEGRHPGRRSPPEPP